MEIGETKAMFHPKTVALIGASDKAGSVGRAILENLILFKEGKAFPVNPNRKTVLGFPCSPIVGLTILSGVKGVDSFKESFYSTGKFSSL